MKNENQSGHTLEIPPPALVELSADWSPWKWQVETFGNAKHYGYPREDKIIRIGMANYETYEAACAGLDRALANHKKFHGASCPA